MGTRRKSGDAEATPQPDAPKRARKPRKPKAAPSGGDKAPKWYRQRMETDRVNARARRAAKITDRDRIARAIITARGVVGEAAHLLGIARNTLWEWTKREPWIREAIESETEALVDVLEQMTAEDAISGDATERRHFLRAKARHRGWGDRVELAGEGGGPISLQVVIPQPMRTTPIDTAKPGDE